MELAINRRHGKISDRQRSYIEEKLGKLQRFFETNNLHAKVEITAEQRRNEGEVQRVEVTLVGSHGMTLRAEEHNHDLLAAVDSVQDTLERQIVRFKEKYWQKRTRRREEVPMAEPSASDIASEGPQGQDTDEDEVRVVRTKQFALKPMFSDEAIEQMELLGHNFFIFRDAETLKISVLYRRRDGDYGILIPQD